MKSQLTIMQGDLDISKAQMMPDLQQISVAVFWLSTKGEYFSTDPIGVGAKYVFGPVLENIGTTMAKNVSATAFFTPINKSVDPKTICSKNVSFYGPQSVELNDIAAGATVSLPSGILSIGDVDMAPGDRLIMSIHVEYHDVFPGDPEQFISWCKFIKHTDLSRFNRFDYPNVP